MKFEISGNLSLGISLPSYVEERINQSISKYIDSDKSEVKVFFSKNGKIITTKIVINEDKKKGILIKSMSESYDIYESFDSALTKILSQLRKYKSKIKNYKNKVSVAELPYILAQRFIIDDNDDDFAETQEQEDLNEDIKVIEEKETEIEELSINEALMKMNLLNLPAFMFINKDNGLINVVYKRPDGLLSWINPKNYKK